MAPRGGRQNALRAAIARCGRWGRPIDVPGAGRGAAGASRGRAGAEKRKSSFLGRLGTTLSRMKLYSRQTTRVGYVVQLSLLVLYSNFIGVKWEKEALVPRVLYYVNAPFF